MNKEAYTIKQVAADVGVGESTIHYYLKQGLIPFYRLLGNVRFSEKELNYIRWFFKSVRTDRRGRKRIDDEHTDKPVSRQRKWQLRHREKENEMRRARRARIKEKEEGK